MGRVKTGISVEPTPPHDIESLRDEFRATANCQIVRDSIIPRGLANSYLLRFGDSVVGYGGVWNEHFPGRVMEFFVRDEWLSHASSLFGSFLIRSGATDVEAQTNIPLQYSLARDHAETLSEENHLFVAGADNSLELAGCVFRKRVEADAGPDGDWVVECAGVVAAAGGMLRHYNPPYVDLYMGVLPEFRRRGIGGFLVQELRRFCVREGDVPAARCDIGNEASRRTLLRGGMVECGTIVSGRIQSGYLRPRGASSGPGSLTT